MRQTCYCGSPLYVFACRRTSVKTRFGHSVVLLVHATILSPCIHKSPVRLWPDTEHHWKSPRGTDPVTHSVTPDVYTLEKESVFKDAHMAADTALDFRERCKVFSKHGSKQNVIRYWTPQCITYTPQKKQPTTDVWNQKLYCWQGCKFNGISGCKETDVPRQQDSWGKCYYLCKAH